MRRTFPEFDNFPAGAKQAILDMQFNLGSTKFRKSRIVDGKEKGWPKLFKAIEQQDWKTAAEESRRGGIGERRNSRTRTSFFEAERTKN